MKVFSGDWSGELAHPLGRANQFIKRVHLPQANPQAGFVRLPSVTVPGMAHPRCRPGQRRLLIA